MEQFIRKYPIGIQTFEEIIEGGYCYVDKTDLIYKMVQTGNYYFLSRPRRFGKSLLITTLQTYFEGKKDLFKGLAIEKLEREWEQYPVFHLDFSGNKYNEDGDLQNVVDLFLKNLEGIYGANESEKTFGSRMQGLLLRAARQTEKQCVVLIDEYDKPLTDTIDKPDIQDLNREILQSLYGVLNSADANIKFAMLTGVTRYGKLGIFSASNNLNDISMAPAFSSICGVTEDELKNNFSNDIEALGIELGISPEDTYEILKRKYDGYHFCLKSKDIYNPFSLLKSLDNKVIANHWFATGTPTYLTKILKTSDFNPALLEGEIYATEENISSFGNGQGNIVAAMYQSGYLTIKDFEDGIYTLGIPNEEVASGLTSYLIPEFLGETTSNYAPEIKALGKYIKNGDADNIMQQLQSIMEEIPFENNDTKMVEAHFRNMVYLLIRATGHKTYVELPKLGGRIDICFETDRFVYIIECKRDQSAHDALMQIEEKKYGKRLSSEGKKVIKIGANFSSKEKNLVEWMVR
ncbi:MAG: ATP-binding protein [Paludibacteraceae bacterium]|nr:ATP-binding protein [Paludibacteraceae bacterium]